MILLKVLVPKNENLMGKMLTVRIVETGKHYLKGHLLSDKDIVQPDVPLPLKKGQVSGASGLVQVSRQWSKLIKNKAHLIDKTKIMHFFICLQIKYFITRF